MRKRENSPITYGSVANAGARVRGGGEEFAGFAILRMRLFDNRRRIVSSNGRKIIRELTKFSDPDTCWIPSHMGAGG